MREELAGQLLNPNKKEVRHVMSVKTLTKEEVPRPTYARTLEVQKGSNSGICRNYLYYVCVHSVHTPSSTTWRHHKRADFLIVTTRRTQDINGDSFYGSYDSYMIP